MVNQILIGDNPFIGISHLSQERAAEEAKASTDAVMERVLTAAVDAGARGFAFSTHPKILRMFRTLAQNGGSDILKRLDYYVLTPYALGYVKQANIGGTVALALKIMRGLGSSFLDFEKIPSLFLRRELDPFLKVLPRGRVKAVLLHEILTEPIIAFRSWSILQKLGDYVSDEIGASFGIETRNLGYLHPQAGNWKIPAEYIMTPANPIGYQMAPSRRDCESAISALGRVAKIIAINTLASGASSLSEAAAYLTTMRDSLDAVTTASVSPERIGGNVRVLLEALHDGP